MNIKAKFGGNLEKISRGNQYNYFINNKWSDTTQSHSAEPRIKLVPNIEKAQIKQINEIEEIIAINGSISNEKSSEFIF